MFAVTPCGISSKDGDLNTIVMISSSNTIYAIWGFFRQRGFWSVHRSLGRPKLLLSVRTNFEVRVLFVLLNFGPLKIARI